MNTEKKKQILKNDGSTILQDFVSRSLQRFPVQDDLLKALKARI